MRLLIVDDSKEVLDELHEIMSAIPGIDIVGLARDEDEAIRMFREKKPDIVCLDIRLQEGSGLNILKIVKEEQPETTVFMLTNYPYPQYKRKCLELGADFFFDKSSEIPHAINILRDLNAYGL